MRIAMGAMEEMDKMETTLDEAERALHEHMESHLCLPRCEQPEASKLYLIVDGIWPKIVEGNAFSRFAHYGPLPQPPEDTE